MEDRHQALVIKAANGKFEDFRVDSLRSWTVKHLKTHISHQHPSRPAVSCQKLICAGKLLGDEQLIREISPESGDPPVVLHLVMYERSLSAPAAVTKPMEPPHATGRRERVEERQEEHEDGEEQRREELPPPREENTAVNQWPRYRGTYPPQWMPGVVPFGALPGFGNYLHPQGYMPPYNPMLAAHIAQWYQNYHGRQLPTEAENDEGIINEGDQDMQILPEQPNGPEIEDNAVAMNAGIGGMDAANIQRRRDLVDYLYMLMMAVFLGAMAFMTGSLGRFLVFAGGIIFMLLNQAGWFSVQRRRQDGPVNAPAPPVPHAPQAQPPPTPPASPPHLPASQQTSSSPTDTVVQDDSTPQLSDHQQQEQEQNEADEGTANPVPPQVTPQPGLLTTIFVFVTSFFASLIPQHHQPVQAN